jgi:hypothetical protein
MLFQLVYPKGEMSILHIHYIPTAELAGHTKTIQRKAPSRYEKRSERVVECMYYFIL